MTRILVLHASNRFSRHTTLSLLRAFRRLPNATVVYHHISAPIDHEAVRNRFDVIFINYCALMMRQSPREDLLRVPYDWIRDDTALKIAFPMDDCHRSAVTEDWCLSFGVSVVLTALYADRDVIYPKLIGKVRFVPALTGYVDPVVAAQSARWATASEDRKIDIGTRVARSPAWHGRYASLKADYAEQVAVRGAASGFTTDVSTDPSRAFSGESWLTFLSSCRATPGMRGGYGLIDPDGSLMARGQAYLQSYPGAAYDDIASACFRGHDHQAVYSCESPRVFDAALTRCVQIMPPDTYFDVLSPWRHYLPLGIDMTGFDDVADALRDSAYCDEIARNCFEALVSEGRFTDDWFLEALQRVLETERSRNRDIRGHSRPDPGGVESPEVAHLLNAISIAGPVLAFAAAHVMAYASWNGSVAAVSELFHKNADAPRQYGIDDTDWRHWPDPTQVYARSLLPLLNAVNALGKAQDLADLFKNVTLGAWGPLALWPWFLRDPAVQNREPDVREAEIFQSDLWTIFGRQDITTFENRLEAASTASAELGETLEFVLFLLARGLPKNAVERARDRLSDRSSRGADDSLRQSLQSVISLCSALYGTD